MSARRIADVAAALVVVAALLLVAPAALGLHRYVITSGSMSGTIATGSLVLDRDVAAATVRTGDIITFVAPGRAHAITHRAVSVDRYGIHTRGDANDATDPWVLPRSGHVRRVVGHVPAVGYAVVALDLPEVRGLMIALLCLGGALLLGAGALRDLREARARREVAP